jgi:hypothetical protein
MLPSFLFWSYHLLCSAPPKDYYACMLALSFDVRVPWRIDNWGITGPGWLIGSGFGEHIVHRFVLPLFYLV